MASQKYWEDDVQISDVLDLYQLIMIKKKRYSPRQNAKYSLERRLERGLMRMAQLYLGLACLSLSLSVLT